MTALRSARTLIDGEETRGVCVDVSELISIRLSVVYGHHLSYSQRRVSEAVRLPLKSNMDSSEPKLINAKPQAELCLQHTHRPVYKCNTRLLMSV